MDLLRELEIEEATFEKRQTEGYVKAFSWRILKEIEVDVEEGRSSKRWIVADLIILTREKILLFYIVRGWKGIVKTSATEGWYVESADHTLKEGKPSPVLEARNRRDLLERNLKAAGLQQEDLKDRLFDYVLFDLHEGSVNKSVFEKHANVLTKESFQSFLDREMPDQWLFMRALKWVSGKTMAANKHSEIAKTIDGLRMLDMLTTTLDQVLQGRLVRITKGETKDAIPYDRKKCKEIKFSSFNNGVKATLISRHTSMLGSSWFCGLFQAPTDYRLSPGSMVQFEVVGRTGEHSLRNFSPSDLELIKLNNLS